jgi:hypothetical protein
MGTPRRDAQRRQVSLTVEALEDRWLLSDAASLSIPAATNGPAVPLPAAHINSAGNEIRSLSPQGSPDNSPPWQATIVPLHPMMSDQRDDDGDNDLYDITDNDNPGSAFFGYPLLFSAGNHALDFALPAGSPAQMALPAASLISFLPLLSASGLGVTSVSPLFPTPSPTAVAENAPQDPDPAPGKEDMRPMPSAPEAPPSALPPLVEESLESPPLPPKGPFVELLPIDVEAIQRGVDAFFQQLSDLSEEWREGQLLEKLAPWLLATSVAGYGWVRLRDRRDRSLADLLGSERLETILTIFLPGGEG